MHKSKDIRFSKLRFIIGKPYIDCVTGQSLLFEVMDDFTLIKTCPGIAFISDVRSAYYFYLRKVFGLFGDLCQITASYIIFCKPLA